jgi:ring-1,2-phenylacetyl-CoA epoxidase subunit PaaC
VSAAAVQAGAASADVLRNYALTLGDTSLILAQRLGEWIGHAPALEEDLALANIGLDLLGQGRHLLAYAAQLEGGNRTEDDLAFLRDPQDFLNLSLVEQPNGDFGETIARQFFIDAWQIELFERLQQSGEPKFADLAAKAIKETRYHLRFSSGWVVRLGDGTQESHRRMQASVDSLWRFTHEMFVASPSEQGAVALGVAPDPASLAAGWSSRVDEVLKEATLQRPADLAYAWHGKRGQHSEHLSRLLAEMQFMQRTYPGAQW